MYSRYDDIMMILIMVSSYVDLVYFTEEGFKLSVILMEAQVALKVSTNKSNILQVFFI